MCGQFELKVKARALSKCLPKLELSQQQMPLADEMNPRDPVLMLLAEAGAYVPAIARWGLAGSFLTRDPHIPVINLCAEGLADTPFYGKIFRRKRCLLPATAFLARPAMARGERQKLRFYHPAGEALLFAAVFDHHPVVGTSCALLTRAAGERRVPVILGRDAAAFWLTDFPEFPAAEFDEILFGELPALLSEVVIEPEASPQLAFKFA